MGYYHCFKNICYVAAIILSLSVVTNEFIPPVHAQTIDTDTKSNPRDAADFLNRGRERFQRGDYKGAISDYNHALVLNPNDANIYYNRAVLLHELGDDLNALSDFDRAVQLNPRDANIYFHRAGARYGLGDEPGTIQDLQLAAKLFRSQGNTKGYQQAQNLIRQLQHSVE
jgi:tetratricopeptide (TPR) repeat protein